MKKVYYLLFLGLSIFLVTACGRTDESQTEEKYQNDSQVHVFEQMNELPDFENEQAVLLNCAFPRSSDGESLSNALEFTKDLADQAAEKQIQHLINISSQSVYIQSGAEIQTEQSAPHPVNLYGMAKFTTEKIVQAGQEWRILIFA